MSDIKKVLIILGAVALSCIMLASTMLESYKTSDEKKVASALATSLSSLSLSEAVEAYKDTVHKHAQHCGIVEYEKVILTIMQAESGGIGTDVMMSGEKIYNTRYPARRGGILDPEYSIEVGCKEIKELINIIGIRSYSEATSEQLLLLFEAYHLDRDYINYCFKQYSEESAQRYIAEKGLTGRDADMALQMQKILSVTAGVVSGGGSTPVTGDQKLDTSMFLNPGIKNNVDLVRYCRNAYNCKWGYVMGTYGEILTPKLFEAKCRQYPDRISPEFQEYIATHYIGGRTADCIGLIKGYMWLDPNSGSIGYAKNGFLDWNTEALYDASPIKGKLTSTSSYPDIGAIVYKKGHVGVYVGSGKVIESAGTMKGVIMSTLTPGTRWTHWIKPNSITYY